MIHIYIILIQIIFLWQIVFDLEINSSDMRKYMKRIQDIISIIGGSIKFISFIPIVLIYF